MTTDPSQDPERRAASQRHTPAQSAVIRALHSLKEDATFAWHEALAGRFDTLTNVGRAYGGLEAAVMQADRERQESHGDCPQ